MKKIFSLLLLFVCLCASSQYTNHRKPIRLVYGGDTLIIYFDSDTVNYESNLAFQKFKDAAIMVDSIQINGVWYSEIEGIPELTEDTSNVKVILDADDSLKYSVNVYAEMYNDSAGIATTITTQNVWYPVENMTQGPVFENATYTTDTIWIDYDGIYLINPGSWAAYGGFTNEFEMGISINGSLPEIQGRTFVGLQSGYQSHSGSSFIKRLSDNDYIVLKVKNISGTDNITFRYGSVTIMKLN